MFTSIKTINQATFLDTGPSKSSVCRLSHPPCVSLSSSPQMKSCSSLLGVSFGSWPSGMMSPALPLCSSPSTMLANSLEGNTAASVSSKSESPLPRIDKISPTLEMPKSLDHPSPQPIPEGECRNNTQRDWLRVRPTPASVWEVEVGCYFPF